MSSTHCRVCWCTSLDTTPQPGQSCSLQPRRLGSVVLAERGLTRRRLSEVVALLGALRAARLPMTAAQRACAAGQLPQHVDGVRAGLGAAVAEVVTESGAISRCPLNTARAVR
jgi:hypothetical protein